jgi:hypothetical protein
LDGVVFVDTIQASAQRRPIKNHHQSPQETPMSTNKAPSRKRNKTARRKAKLKRKNTKRVLRMAGVLKGRRDRGQKKRS